MRSLGVPLHHLRQRRARVLACALLLALPVLVGGGCCGGDDTVPIPIYYDVSVELVQLDYVEFGGYRGRDTPFGGAYFDFDAPPGVLFLNLWGETGALRHHLVDNLPVVTGCGGPGRVYVAIDLRPFQQDLGRAEVLEIRHARSLTTLPVGECPATFDVGPVASQEVRFATGVQGVELLPPAPPSPGVALRSALTWVQEYPASWACHAWFPNQEAGLWECVPVAVSNSLKFLDAGAGQNDVADGKLMTGFDGTGAPFNWPYLKRDATTGPPYEVTTTVLEGTLGSVATHVAHFREVLQAIQDGKDVEVNNYAHVAAVVAAGEIFAPGRSIYVLHVAHDVNQGQPGGTRVEVIVYDPETNTYSGGTPGFFDTDPHMRFVIESKP